MRQAVLSMAPGVTRCLKPTSWSPDPEGCGQAATAPIKVTDAPCPDPASSPHIPTPTPPPSTQAGMTSINDFATTYMCQSLPFGGVKHSGFDRFAGVEGLRGLCVPKVGFRGCQSVRGGTCHAELVQRLGLHLHLCSGLGRWWLENCPTDGLLGSSCHRVHWPTHVISSSSFHPTPLWHAGCCRRHVAFQHGHPAASPIPRQRPRIRVLLCSGLDVLRANDCW